MEFRTDEEKRKLIRSWHSSGLTKTEFCKIHKISSSSFYKWARELGITLDTQTCKSEMAKSKSTAAIQTYVELDTTDLEVNNSNQRTGRMIRIVTSYGAVLEVPL